MQEESARRVLQKDTFVANRKIATKRLIARKNAKHNLLNLRDEVINGLEEEGFLREDTYVDLRVQYEGWLYEQIKMVVQHEASIEATAEGMVHEKEREIRGQHEGNIEKERKRRRDILEERERIRKENEERKLKKRIRK